MNPAVIEILEWELVGKYTGLARDVVETDRVRVVFEPEKDAFSPGEPIFAWAKVTESDGITPIYEADVHARLVFREPLPGSEAPDVIELQESSPAWVRLDSQPGSPGRYEAALPAVMEEGYYDLEAKVNVLNETMLRLYELVFVEAVPELSGITADEQVVP